MVQLDLVKLDEFHSIFKTERSHYYAAPFLDIPFTYKYVRNLKQLLYELLILEII